MKPDRKRPAGDRLPLYYRAMNVFTAPVERALGIDCRSFTRIASRRMDGPLDWKDALKWRVHRAICALCRRQDDRQNRLAEVVRLAAGRGAFDADATLPDAAKQRLRAKLVAEMEEQVKEPPGES